MWSGCRYFFGVLEEGPLSKVELVGLRKTYGHATVLHDIDLQIGDGEFIALVGPSGCGKSTMLRMIAGLEEITSGEVRVGGRRVNDETPKQRNIAMVFQNYALYPHMSVEENIGLNLKIAGMPKTQIRDRVTDVARLLDIQDLLKRRPGQLSGGQRQRVAMGRAIVRDPAVFLFDEPLSNLDAKLRVQMRSEIKALQTKVRKTSIYVTHDQIEAMTLADRVVVMNRGVIEQQGEPIELYESPANLFVAGFIGSPAMNFLNASAKREADRLVIALDGLSTTIDCPPKSSVIENQAILVGIRPEHLVRGPGPIQIAGQVEYVEPTGAQTQIVFSAAGQELNAVVVGNARLNHGEPISFAVEPSSVHLFDAHSGQRI
jgi:multiple sugar transport system ATP-binding protein